MGQDRRPNFWRAGAAPVRPVRTIRDKGGDGREAKDVKKSAIKEKKSVRFAEGDSRRDYAEAVAKEEQEQEEGIRRESPITGGSRASNDGAAAEEEEDKDEETGEGRKPISMTVPEGPSNQEREEHELTHIPYRSWCEHCVKGRARSRAHKRRDPEVKRDELRRMTRIYLDFYYNGIGEEEEEREEAEGVQDDDEGKEGDSPSIVMYDSQYKLVASWVMQSKSVREGGPNQWIPKILVKELEEWGYGNKRLILVSDGEAAIKALKDKMISLREVETIPEETPVGEHNANLAEGMVRRVREQVRVLISQIESGVGGKISKDAVILQWAVNWAAKLISNYQVGEDGRTAFERM